MLYVAPSGIHGVGVFTSASIAKGSAIRLFARGDYRFAGRPVGMEQRYCVETNRPAGGYWRPRDFHRMSIGYYLNHHDRPNVQACLWRALRRIEPGEELTIDYARLWPPSRGRTKRKSQ